MAIIYWRRVPVGPPAARRAAPRRTPQPRGCWGGLIRLLWKRGRLPSRLVAADAVLCAPRRRGEMTHRAWATWPGKQVGVALAMRHWPSRHKRGLLNKYFTRNGAINQVGLGSATQAQHLCGRIWRGVGGGAAAITAARAQRICCFNINGYLLL